MVHNNDTSYVDSSCYSSQGYRFEAANTTHSTHKIPRI